MKFLVVAFLIASTFCSGQELVQSSVDPGNAGAHELNPVLTQDGKFLYFTVGQHDLNTGGKRDPGDIWFSLLAGGQWTAPINAGNVLNDVAYNAVAGFSADGNTMFLLSHYD